MLANGSTFFSHDLKSSAIYWPVTGLISRQHYFALLIILVNCFNRRVESGTDVKVFDHCWHKLFYMHATKVLMIKTCRAGQSCSCFK